MLTHSRMRVTLGELETTWSVDDVLDAHAVLDAIEAAEAKMRERT